MYKRNYFDFILITFFFAVITSCTFSSDVAPVAPTSTSPPSSSAPIGSSYSDCVLGAINLNPCVLKQSGVAVVSDFGSDILSWNLHGSRITAPIPNGFYMNHTVEFDEPNLLPGNIVNGVSIFGVAGNASIGCDSTLTFAGVTATSGVNATSLTVSWTDIPAAKGYVVLNVTNTSSPKIIATTDAGQTQQTLSGLTANTNYTFKVKALTASGSLDCNSVTTSVTTSATLLPSDLSGLAVWLNNDSLVSFNNNDPVTQWNDSSGNARHFSQNTGSLKPKYVTNQLNSRGGLQFDGIDDNMMFNSEYASNNFTIFVVTRATASHENDFESSSGINGTTGQRYLFYPTQAGAVDSGIGISLGVNGIGVYDHGDAHMPALAVHSATLTSAHSLTVSVSSKTPSIYLNGSLVRAGITSPRANVWSPKVLGGDTPGYFQGEVFEVIIFNRTLTPTERTDMNNYLNSKFAL
ncbi:MAG: fibronectin type III domain-containing protein [Bdellovibrionaceae bacterium]|nr:fibronectin type III domain-containing protein [Pseudobdellovibrionaceae bacterium]